MPNVKLHNHGARVVTIHTGGSIKDGDEIVAGRVDLAPGLNIVSGEMWKAITEQQKTNPALAALFNAEQAKTAIGPGHLEFKGESKGDEGGANDTTAPTGGVATPSTAVDTGLSEHTAEEAKEMISDTLDRNQLEAWKRGEQSGKNRTTVISALDAQIAKVTPEAAA